MGSLGRGFRWASPSGSGRHEKVPAGGVSGVGLSLGIFITASEGQSSL